MRWKWVVLTCIGALLAAGLAISLPADEPPAKHGSVIMRNKLEHSQRILEGLANEDFEMIRHNAKIMSLFTQLEGWYRGSDPRYDAQLSLFRFANNELIRTAQDKNLDGAALAYTQLTISCVNCHRLVREKQK